ncbi:hypothetical protein C9994_14150 [Marivirga lumbricoides]|uniref:Right handed beta helix domain-containing protein n=1 Tax=Marivirga lumbricoides TaxID=1046115 RepID=A0A2T4DF63_9BACT|nr:hypothetical protein C9994_14150 [Marivirga lumbricoides]
MKLHKIFPGFILILLNGLFFFSACSYEPEIEEQPVQLTFSADTIQFDTIFAERKSITRRLLVKNPSKNAISIDQIGLSSNILVDSSCSLTIEPGTKIYSANNSFILVAGTLKAEGTAENPVIFMNDRLDEPFASAPGQWGGIVFLEGSTDNYFSHTQIKNGVVGLNLNIFNRDGEADVVVENSLIGNMTFSAVLSLNSEFTATNSVFFNTALGTISHIGGGLATYQHCTIAN